MVLVWSELSRGRRHSSTDRNLSNRWAPPDPTWGRRSVLSRRRPGNHEGHESARDGESPDRRCVDDASRCGVNHARCSPPRALFRSRDTSRDHESDDSLTDGPWFAWFVLIPHPLSSHVSSSWSAQHGYVVLLLVSYHKTPLEVLSDPQREGAGCRFSLCTCGVHPITLIGAHW